MTSRHMVLVFSVSSFLIRFTTSISLRYWYPSILMWLSGKLKSSLLLSTHRISTGASDNISFKCVILFHKEFVLRKTMNGLLEKLFLRFERSSVPNSNSIIWGEVFSEKWSLELYKFLFKFLFKNSEHILDKKSMLHLVQVSHLSTHIKW